MLFLGNSYTIQNDLEAKVAALFGAAGEEVVVERLATPGWRFVDHVGAIETTGTAHAAAFGASQDWVLLQEQSQIPGFPAGQADLEASRAAAVTLDGYAAATGATTVFLMTWGRRDGDTDNPDLYPDYTTMQAALTDGYLAYVEAAGADGTPAYVAPAGLAWAWIHDDVAASGADPLAAGSPFADLYVADGSHPSPRGTYLAACVVYATLTGRSPVGLPAPDGVDDAAYLQEAAATVVLEGEGIVYPWTGGPDDTGADDTGDDDTGDDTGADDTGTDPDDTDGAEDTGCGCATGARAGAGLALVAMLAVTRRRR